MLIKRWCIDRRQYYSSYTYEKALFDFDDEVYPVAKVESDTIKKVYWIDKNNPLRVINLVTPLNSQDPTSFNVIKKSELYSPKLHEIIGGSLKTGIIPVCLLLYQQNGSETIIVELLLPYPYPHLPK